MLSPANCPPAPPCQLPHFNTLPEPPATTEDELLLRRQADTGAALRCVGVGQAMALLNCSSPRAEELHSPANLATRAEDLHPPANLATRAEELHSPATPCSRDALSPEALNIASYDTRQRERMADRGGAGLKLGLGQAIKDIK